jgi:putative transposase
MTQLQGTPAEGHSVDRMCALTGVSRASYYRRWHESAPRREETALRDVVQRLALANKHYGYRRICALLPWDGWCINHKRVVRVMREDNLLCLRRAAFKPPTTDSNHNFKVYPNLARRLVPTTVNQLWVADITYVRLAEAFVYLAVLLDAFSRKVVGWAMEDHLKASLALAALEMALKNRDVAPGGLVHHSDRGVQYACSDYIGRLESARIQPSMEEVDGSDYRDIDVARLHIGGFIETVYNRQRLHSALNHLSPMEFEGRPFPSAVMVQQKGMASTNCP